MFACRVAGTIRRPLKSRTIDPLATGAWPAQPSVALGAVTVVLTLVGWSSVPLFLRHFADSIDLWTSNGWRYGFSALVWLPVLVVAWLRRRMPRGIWRAAVVPSIYNAVGQTCFTWAFYLIDPALVTFGLRAQLIFVAIGAWIMFPRERAIIRTPAYLAGAALLIVGMIGVMAMAPETVASASAHDLHARGSPAAHAWGVTLAIFSGLLFACYGLSVRKYMDGANPVLAFAAICQYTAIMLVAVMLAVGQDCGIGAWHLGANEFVKLLASALIGIAIGHVFYYISLARLGVAVTAGVLQLQPFLVAIASLWMFDERLTGWQWTGGCVAVGGAILMLMVQRIKSRQKRVSERPVEIAEGESGG